METISNKETLGSALVSVGVISPANYQAALKKAAGDERKVSQELVELGFCTEAQIMKGLGILSKIPYFVALEGLVEENIKELVPESLCRRYQVMPLFRTDDLLMAAMLDPYDIPAIDEIGRHTHMQVKPVLSTRKAIFDAIKATYSKTSADIEKAIKIKVADNIRKAVDDFKTDMSTAKDQIEIISDFSEITSPDAAASYTAAPEAKAPKIDQPLIKLVDHMILEAVEKKASDIHIEPWTDKLDIRYRLDGMLHKVMELPKELAPSVTARVKIMARMDISVTRSPQDGKMQVKLPGGSIVDMRVNTLPLATGEKTAIRILDKQAMTPELTQLGFPPETFKEFVKTIKSANGIILVTGPTGSGKTTTLYSALKTITDECRNISTLEDPVEYQIDGICQVQVNPQVGLTFANGFRALLRQDPNVMLVGEIRDLETAEIAIQAALTGHLVLSTLHTNDAVGAIFRLNNMNIDPFLLNSSLRGVLAQRLVRLLCPVCRVPYTPEDELLADLGLEKKDGPYTFYRETKNGCKNCTHTGFKGRRGIFELLPLSAGVREQIIRRGACDRIGEEAVRAGFRTMRQHGVELIVNGETTAEEVLRVTTKAENV